MTNDYASGSIIGGAADSGGLVAMNGGIVSSSHTSVKMRATGQRAGGLVAFNGGAIILSSADGYVRGGGEAGGLAGENDNAITESFAGGNIISSNGGWTGGLVGQNVSNDDGIQNSYATGSARCGTSGECGGLIGQNSDDSQASFSYSVGFVSGGDVEEGGFIGWEDVHAQMTSSYWDTTTSGTEQSVGEGELYGVTGLTSAELKGGLPAGFDPAIWREKKGVNHGFPYLINNPPPKD